MRNLVVGFLRKKVGFRKSRTVGLISFRLKFTPSLKKQAMQPLKHERNIKRGNQNSLLYWSGFQALM
jgi:hypothetical protein